MLSISSYSLRIISSFVLGISVTAASAQVTTGPSLPPAVSPSAPAAPRTAGPQSNGGSGVGVGVNIDVGRLLRGMRAPALPPGVLAPGNSLVGPAKSTASSPDLQRDMERNTIVNHGMITRALSGPCPDQATLAAFANQINQQIMASGRFDQLNIDGASGMTPAQLTQAISKAIDEHAESVARARLEGGGDNYDFRYRDTIITGDAIRQVINSIYSYEIVFGAPVTQKVETPQGTRYVTTVPVTVNFYKVVTSGANGKPLPAAQQIQSVPGAQINFGLTGLATSSDPCPGIQAAFAGYATAANTVTTGVQAIPMFAARGRAVEAFTDGAAGNGGVGAILTMRPGANEGIKVGDKYELIEIRPDGTKIVVGHAEVVKVGTGLVANGDGASKADVTENRTQLRVTQLNSGYSQNLQGIQMQQQL